MAKWSPVSAAELLYKLSSKIAELMDLPFALCSLVGGRKHSFNRVRQVAPMCPDGREDTLHGATSLIRLNRPSAAVMRPYVKLLRPLGIANRPGQITFTIATLASVMRCRSTLPTATAIEREGYTLLCTWNV